MPDLITDEDFVNAVYKWNLLFFEGRMIATNEPKDKKKYNSKSTFLKSTE